MNFNIFNLFRKPTALQIAKIDLEEGQRQLLKHQEAADYHAQMVAFHVVTNDRLDLFIRTNTMSLTPAQPAVQDIKPAPKRAKLATVLSTNVVLTP